LWVHYPIDIVFGALLGSGIGALTAGYYNRKIGPITLSQNETSLAQ